MIFEKSKRTVSYILIVSSITLLGLAVWYLIEEHVLGWVFLGLAMFLGVVLVAYNMYEKSTRIDEMVEVGISGSWTKPVERKITTITEDNPEELVKEAEELLVDVSDFLDNHSATSKSEEIMSELKQLEKRLRSMLSLLNYMRVAPHVQIEMRQRYQDVQERLQMIQYLNKKDRQKSDLDEMLKPNSKKIFSLKS